MNHTLTIRTISCLLLAACLHVCSFASDSLRPVITAGHSAAINSACFSPDGRQVATASDDGTAKLWDAATGRELRTYAGHNDQVHVVAFSPDGKQLLTGSEDNTAKLWDLASGRELKTFDGRKVDVISVAFSPNARQVLIGWWDNTASIWDVDTCRELRELQGHDGPVTAVAYSKSGRHILTGSDDKTARLWDTATGKEIRRYLGHTRSVSSGSFSPNGDYIVTGSGDETAKIWQTKTGDEVQTFIGHTSYVTSVAFSPDGNRILTGSFDRSAKLWDIKTGMELQTFEGHRYHVKSVSFSPDGSQVLTGSRDHTAKLWDAVSGRIRRTFKGNANRVYTVGFSPSGHQVLTGTRRRLVQYWNQDELGQLRTLGEHNNVVTCASFSADGLRFATGSSDKTVKLWDAQNGRVLLNLQGHTEGIRCICFSPTGERILTGSFDDTAKLWDADSGRLLATLEGHKYGVHSVSFSPNGKQILTGSGGTATIWDVVTRRQLKTLEIGGSSMSLCSDGKQILTASDSGAKLQELHSGREIRVFEGHKHHAVNQSFSSFAMLSPDGQQVVTSWDNFSAQISDVSTGRRLSVLNGHTYRIEDVDFSPGGEYVLTGASDGTTRIWTADSGNELATLMSFGDDDWIVLTPNGSFDGSPNATNLLHYSPTTSNVIIPLERYRKKFEVPGLLAKVLNGELIGHTSDLALEPPPTVNISRAHIDDDGTLKVSATAKTNGKLSLEKFQLLVDGRPITENLGVVEVKESSAEKATAKWSTKLTPGRHDVSVLAYTEIVYGKSESRSVIFRGASGPIVRLPKLYILSVGVSDYESDNVEDLDFAHSDATAIASAFQTHSRELHSDIQVKILTDEDATADNILDGLEWLRRSSTQNDYAVFYFAGHGKKDERGELYFLPHEVDPRRLSRTGIRGDTVNLDLTSTVGQVTAIFDACHAGAIGNDNKGRSLTDGLLRDLTTEEKGIRVICSTTGNEVAQESREHRHGVFTQAILEALSGKAEKSPDGAVYFKQLDAYVTDRVRDLTNGYQHAITKIPISSRDFPISKPKL